jgi:hypothetical protein
LIQLKLSCTRINGRELEEWLQPGLNLSFNCPKAAMLCHQAVEKASALLINGMEDLGKTDSLCMEFPHRGSREGKYSTPLDNDPT